MQMKISKKKFKDFLFCLFIFAPFLFPTGLQYSSLFSFFFNKVLFFWRIISCCFCVFLFLKSNSFNKTIVYFFLTVLSLFLSTFYMNSSLISYFSTWGAYFCFFIGCQAFFKNKPISFIIYLRNWLLFISIINLLSMLLFPNGLPLDRLIIRNSDSRLTWIWGFKNSLCNLLIPLLLFQFTLSEIEGRRHFSFLNIIVCLICILTSLYSHSSTLIISIILFIFLLLFHNSKTLYRIIRPNYVTFFGVLLSLLIVFFNIQNIFSWLIENILEKNVSLSSRTILWSYAIDDISKSPFLGYGVQNSSSFGLLRYASTFSHCHNAVLTILYQGGLLSLSFYGLFFYSCVSMKKSVKRYFLLYVYSVLLLIQLIFHITGSISSVGIFVLLVFISNFDLIDNLHFNKE